MPMHSLEENLFSCKISSPELLRLFSYASSSSEEEEDEEHGKLSLPVFHTMCDIFFQFLYIQLLFNMFPTLM